MILSNRSKASTFVIPFMRVCFPLMIVVNALGNHTCNNPYFPVIISTEP